MNFDRLLALHHISVAWHGGQFHPLYRLGCIVGRVMTPAHSEEYAITLDREGYEESRRLYGVYALALTSCEDASGAYECACCNDVIVCEAWEAGIARCDDCRLHDCDHRGCNAAIDAACDAYADQ